MERIELTKKQGEVFSYMQNALRETQHIPTYREIAEEFSMTVKSAYDAVRALHRKGWVSFVESPLGIRRIRLEGVTVDVTLDPIIRKNNACNF